MNDAQVIDLMEPLGGGRHSIYAVNLKWVERGPVSARLGLDRIERPLRQLDLAFW